MSENYVSKNSSNSHPFLCVENLGYQIDEIKLLSDISFEISAGERVAIFGPSGAGKSTLIRLLNRLDEPSDGTVYLEGQDYRQIPPRKLRRRLGMVMQQPNLFPGTVGENIRFGPQAQGKLLEDEKIEALLSSVDLEGFADREVSKLSGGEAQRVNLARTLANQPEVLLLDEPTSSLDQDSRQEVEQTIMAILQSRGVTCILVSHDRDQVQRLSDRVLLLEDGRLKADGSTREILNA